MSMQFTPAQKWAIETIHGDLSIDAGAGSGKTTVLAQRYVAMVDDLMVDLPTEEVLSHILTITYTEKAAGEIRDRIRLALRTRGHVASARSIDEAWISTIHGFCNRILRRHALESGIDLRFTVLDQTNAGRLFDEAFDQALLGRMGEADLWSALGTTVSDGKVLRQATRHTHDRIRSMGLDPERAQLRLGEELLGDMLAGVGSAIRVYIESAPADTTRSRSVQTKVADAVQTALFVDEARETRGELDLASVSERLVAWGRHTAISGCRAEKAAAVAAIQRVVQLSTMVQRRGQFEMMLDLLREAAAVYRDMKSRLGVLDYDDLQEHVRSLFLTHPEVAGLYQERFRHLMIDEFQDTNALQMQLVDSIRNRNLCIVGDEYQSIYAFRNADVAVFRATREAMKDGERGRLSDNFRSHCDVLAYVNAVFSHDAMFGSGFPVLEADPKQGHTIAALEGSPRVEMMVFEKRKKVEDRMKAETEAVAAKIKSLTDRHVPVGGITILVRTWSQAACFAEALTAVGIPAVIERSEVMYEESLEAQEIASLSRVISLPLDDERMAFVLNGRIGGLDARQMAGIRRAAGPKKALWHGMERIAHEEDGFGLMELERASIVALYNTIGRLRRLHGTIGLRDLLSCAVEATGYLCTLTQAEPDNHKPRAAVRAILSVASEFEASRGTRDAGEFFEYMKGLIGSDASLVVAETGDSAHAVSIMSVHAAKGREFPVVFVSGLDKQAGLKDDGLQMAVVGVRGGPEISFKVNAELMSPLYANRRDEMKAADREEQKRLLYVACTRAKELLILSGHSPLGEAPDPDWTIDWFRMAAGIDADNGIVRVNGIDVATTQFLNPAEETPGEDVEGFDESEAEGVEPARGGVLIRPRHHARPELVTLAQEAASLEDEIPPVSFSAMCRFDDCAYGYFGWRILGMGEPLALKEEEAAVDFGAAFHEYMCSRSGVSDRHAVAAVVRRHRLDEEGVRRIGSAEAWFDATETAAAVRNTGDERREMKFMTPLAGTYLVGSMDLVGVSEGGEWHVVDFKTGSKHQQAHDRYRLQAECYSFAALKAGASRMSVTLAFVEDGERVSFMFDSADLDTVEAGLGARVLRMHTSDFPPRAEYEHGICTRCALVGGLCPVDTPRRRNR